MNTFKCRSNVARCLDFDEGAEAGKGFQFGGKDVEEGSSENVHALDVGRSGVNSGWRRRRGANPCYVVGC